MGPARVLILCTGNSARSQMAEGLLRKHGGDRFEVFSAGTHPSIVHPDAIVAMAEIGIDISGHRSKSVGEFAGERFDYIITVCSRAAESCPLVPGRAERLAWDFDDPAAVEPATRLAAFRRVRDEILDHLRTFLLLHETKRPA
jgi:arsenate reductase